MLSMTIHSEWQKEFQAIIVSIIKPRIDPVSLILNLFQLL